MQAKKSLGQNFLKSKEAVRLIISATDIQKGDVVLEVGPGKGVLTAELLSAGAKVIAVEKDEMLVNHLQELFKEEIKSGSLTLIAGDILEFKPEDLKKYSEQYKIAANIPYYITGVFLRKFLETEFQPTKMVLLVQKEVAQRIVAKDGKESILSISVKAYGTPKYVKTVQAKYFSPAPKVDSAIIFIDTISKNFFLQNNINEKKFFGLVKAGFAHKRKMLRGNLNFMFENIEEVLKKNDIPENARAEDISLEDWKKLIRRLSQVLG